MHSLVLDRAETYLNTQWRESNSPWLSKTLNSHAFVTVSRQSGSGGTAFARALARQLNGDAPDGIVWTVSEGNLTTRMLEANHLSPHIARYLPEDKVSELNASIGELVGLHPNLWELVQKMNKAMRDLAEHNHAILVGRGANFATRDLEGGVHVRLVAAPEHRARYHAFLYDMTEQEALAFNAKVDVARRRYVKATFNANIDDPRAYDLVLNTGVIPIPEAAAITASLVKTRHALLR
jgi:cytidylate kinase